MPPRKRASAAMLAQRSDAVTIGKPAPASMNNAGLPSVTDRLSRLETNIVVGAQSNNLKHRRQQEVRRLHLGALAGITRALLFSPRASKRLQLVAKVGECHQFTTAASTSAWLMNAAPSVGLHAAATAIIRLTGLTADETTLSLPRRPTDTLAIARSCRTCAPSRRIALLALSLYGMRGTSSSIIAVQITRYTSLRKAAKACFIRLGDPPTSPSGPRATRLRRADRTASGSC
jgi:hypothetical protein